MENKRIGEQNTTKYKQTMTIIAYRGSGDIDVQFEDGTIVEHKSYSSFKSGKIFNPNYFKNKFIGQTNVASNGQYMKIVDYINSKNITIEFEDGTIVYNKSYDHFKNGAVLNPNCPNTTWCKNRINKFAKKRIGESNIALNGMKMTIVEYHNAKDIDIRFDDGTVVSGIAYSSFQKGLVENPNYRIATSVSVNEYAVLYYLSALGFRKSHKNELNSLGFGHMELDCYHPDLKIAIEYDGIWHNQKRQEDLKKNKLCVDNGILLIRIREPKCNKLNSTSVDYYLDSKAQLNANLEAVIKDVICYINSITELNINVDIDLTRDRNDIFNKYRQIYKSSRVGQTSIAHNGMLMTILEYRGTNDIDIQFDDGTIVCHQTYHAFKTGNVRNPNFIKLASKRIGETSMSNNGQSMQIVEYRGVNDIDVMFEDGTVVMHRPYHCFKTGQIANPNHKRSKWTEERRKNFVQKRVGENAIAVNEQVVTIISYRNYNDIDVQFEDGTIIEHERYYRFTAGKIKNPNCKKNITEVN